MLKKKMFFTLQIWLWWAFKKCDILFDSSGKTSWFVSFFRVPSGWLYSSVAKQWLGAAFFWGNRLEQGSYSGRWASFDWTSICCEILQSGTNPGYETTSSVSLRGIFVICREDLAYYIRGEEQFWLLFAVYWLPLIVSISSGILLSEKIHFIDLKPPSITTRKQVFTKSHSPVCSDFQGSFWFIYWFNSWHRDFKKSWAPGKL